MTEIEQLGEKHRQDRVIERGSAEQLRQAVVAAVTAGTVSEAEAARQAGVDRMTVRKWLGKGKVAR